MSVRTLGEGGLGPGMAALEEGLASFAGRDLPVAHAAFERAHRRDPNEPRAMSWYGVTLVLVARNWTLGVELCDRALRASGPETELLLNAARAHLALNQRERALRHVVRGLELRPDDARLRAARDALGRRATPVLPFLRRSNPANVWLGRLRHRWRSRNAAGREVTPVSLGDLPPLQSPQPPRS
jgi:tetratricopeptide (TPR) repeat protein